MEEVKEERQEQVHLAFFASLGLSTLIQRTGLPVSGKEMGALILRLYF